MKVTFAATAFAASCLQLIHAVNALSRGGRGLRSGKGSNGQTLEVLDAGSKSLEAQTGIIPLLTADGQVDPSGAHLEFSQFTMEVQAYPLQCSAEGGVQVTNHLAYTSFTTTCDATDKMRLVCKGTIRCQLIRTMIFNNNNRIGNTARTVHGIYNLLVHQTRTADQLADNRELQCMSAGTGGKVNNLKVFDVCNIMYLDLPEAFTSRDSPTTVTEASLQCENKIAVKITGTKALTAMGELLKDPRTDS